MNTIPKITKLENEAAIWTNTFEKFKATVYVPAAKPELQSQILNYGFIAPYLLVFAPKDFSFDEAVNFARQKGFEKLAADFASSVVFIYPTSGNWNSAAPDILSEIITNSRIHQYYENGVVKAWNRFTNKIDGYFIRGAIFRACLYGFDDSANYIAKNCIKHFEGDGLWGRSDLAPVTCALTNVTVEPDVQADDIPVVSYGNSEEINKLLASKCKYFLQKAAPSVEEDYYNFSQKFRRMIGKLDIDPDLLSAGLIREPGVATVATSADNNGDDKGTKTHQIGYFAFYNKGIFDKEPVPLVLGFHGGGDSCFFFSIMAGWQKIAHRHNFLLVTVENHLNSSATEMVELVEILKKKYNIDQTRIYATGFSMGGIKTWDLIQEYPNLIAAAAPMDATVDIGENVYFQKINKPVNKSVPVPIFYAAGEITPLAELPCQEQKCINRMKYALELNHAVKNYNVKLEDKATWENKLWGINGDIEEKHYDETRDATLTLQLFKNDEGKVLNVFASISGQGHDCREHTCEYAWQFMSQFTRAPSKPTEITDNEYRYDSFKNGKTLLGKKKAHLPAMGWNSWNAFGSGNTEALTKSMADCIISLDLDKFGYKYLVLDDGCYKSQRVQGKLSNEEVKFPGGFKALSEYIHSRGLKFGMYNDIGTNLCAGAAVGTCGHEKVDAASYVDWGVDFLKIDNCYYLWDNATFSNPTNAKYVYAPKIKSIKLMAQGLAKSGEQLFSAVSDCTLTGLGAKIEADYVCNIGTFDGTNTGTTPVGPRSGELTFTVDAGPEPLTAELVLNYATGEEPGTGSWLQLAVENDNSIRYFYDDFLPASPSKDSFIDSQKIKIELAAGKNTIRIMNHRRQENTLCSYAAMLEGLNLANPKHDILISLCEWGKTQPQNWGYKIGDSWRILNDITFRVGSDGNPGYGSWEDPGTPSVTSQYNKAVVMDEFAGLDKGWNDPDMLMIGMTGLTSAMNKTHFTMWCMLNAPLMLGLDLRRVQKGDELYNIIANNELIQLNQDALGIQSKRVFTSIKTEAPDKEYIQDNERIDILAKPLADGAIALSFINLSQKEMTGDFAVSIPELKQRLGSKFPQQFDKAKSFTITDLWTKEKTKTTTARFAVEKLAPCENVTIRITPDE